MSNYEWDDLDYPGLFQRLENACQPQNTSSPRCIYRTPKLLRMVNEAAYTPRLVSIGPYHYGNEDLQMMEKVKDRYLRNYLDRTQRKLSDILSNIRDCEEELKSYYAEEVTLSDISFGIFDISFVEMILLDGVFIIQLFLQVRYPDRFQSSDEIFLQHVPDLINDLFFMQENQLPWSFIEKLYNEDVIQHVPDRLPFLDLALSICSRHVPFIEELYNKDVIQPEPGRKPFLGLALTICSRHVPSPFPERCPDIDMIRGLGVKHLHDLLRTTIIHPLITSHIKHPPQSDEHRQQSAQRRLSATVLHEAGVEFVVHESESFLDIKFEKGKGVLYMPKFIFDRNTETFAKNLIAYEQCHYQDYTSHTYLCDYFYLMDTLINTSKDVDLLAKSGIITNWLGDNDEVATLVNSLVKHVQIDANQFYYANQCEDLNEHCKISWNNYKTTFKREYLSTPWKVASTFAAIILLFLTLIQTVCSLISLFK